LLLIDTYYQAFLKDNNLDVATTGTPSYADALSRAVDAGFGTGGAYTNAFRSLGWLADIVVPNSLTLQSQWAHEHDVRPPIPLGWQYGPHLARLPLANSMLHKFPHLHGMVLEQVKDLRPDVVMVQDINLIPPALAGEIKKYCKLLVGEIASPLPPQRFLMSYDIILSALPSIVDTARSWGLLSEWIPLGFNEKWATISSASTRPIEAIFVGSFSRLQKNTGPMLAEVARLVPGLEIYGPEASDALSDCGLSGNYRGQAWGKDMFELLGRSKVVLNRHGEIAGPYAVNMRMFESTGSGALLVTENKQNLSALFEPEVEVLGYDNSAHAATLARDVLADPARLDAIALAGQRRTLESHTYLARARTMAVVFENLLASDGKSTGQQE
jgi:spore maturation protein CgeB